MDAKPLDAREGTSYFKMHSHRAFRSPVVHLKEGQKFSIWSFTDDGQAHGLTLAAAEKAKFIKISKEEEGFFGGYFALHIHILSNSINIYID